MSESFAELFEESLKTLNLQAGSIITGVIVDIDYQARWVTVHAGLKSEALIPLEQFYNDAGDLTINVGDEVHVALDSVEDGFGETKLSRDKEMPSELCISLEAS
ncbi:S1 RNA-binding domain-containing protein, partial [Pseudomonas helmanticensis]|uniref:S1 RNA-binding domain-containing protein n=1 Tax=Pseudomonas helmanticensis TaxID=1471381 RepID=UPI00380A23FC